MVIVALIAATSPISSSAQRTEDLEPPSTQPTVSVLLAVASPTLDPIEVGKSMADEQREREEAQKAEAERVAAEKKAAEARQAAALAKKQAQERAERIKHTAAEKSLNVARSEQKQAEYVKIIGNSREQCVIYVRRITGNSKVQGYAGDLRSEGQTPKVGAAALERNYGHVSVVIAIDGDYLILHDANYSTGHITERRVHKSTQRGYIY